jgi:hypothetical protein
MLAGMKSRALFLVGALLASSAWAQESTFDLKSDAIRKIVNETAASQSRPVQLSKAKPVERRIVLDTEDLRPLETPIKIAAPRQSAKPRPQGPVSALVDAVVDSVVDDALGLDDTQYTKWVACQSVTDPEPSLPPIAACPGVAVPNGK